MWLLLVSVVLAVLKLLAQQEVLNFMWLQHLSWWWVVASFGLTATWWAYADASGLTKRQANARVQQRRLMRMEKTKQALRDTGTQPPKR
ncbi:MAG: TIGR04438 family Trp-rich protein [Comamonas sp.]|nr:TIGR04438 family Trp-rich protein [Comamonas sp.]